MKRPGSKRGSARKRPGVRKEFADMKEYNSPRTFANVLCNYATMRNPSNAQYVEVRPSRSSFPTAGTQGRRETGDCRKWPFSGSWLPPGQKESSLALADSWSHLVLPWHIQTTYQGNFARQDGAKVNVVNLLSFKPAASTWCQASLGSP